jgi:undecaprenyl-diphosphatase
VSLWFAALLGFVQGITEFLPISSTAHLRIVPALLGRPDPGAAFTAVIQLGTLLAVIVYFIRDLWGMGRGLLVDRGGHQARLALHVIVGTIPIGVAGVLGKSFITGDARSLYVVATTLVIVGVVMWLADRNAKQTRTLAGMGLLDASIIGLAQACALIPGVSRSGATLTAALLVGLRRDDAARFSFLLSIPAIGAAGVFELKDAASDLGREGIPALVVATLVSAIVGYASIAWLLRFLRSRTLLGFSIYRVALGGLLYAMLAAGVIAAFD